MPKKIANSITKIKKYFIYYRTCLLIYHYNYLCILFRGVRYYHYDIPNKNACYQMLYLQE